MSDIDSKSRETEVPWPVIAIAAPLVFASLIHAVQTRTLDDFVKYSLYIAIPIAAVAAPVIAWEWRKAGYPALGVSELLAVPFALVGLLLVGAFYYAIAASLSDLYKWLQSPSLSRGGAIALAIGATLILGAGLFLFRLKLRAIYGVTEATVGLAVAAHRVSIESSAAAQDPAFYLALLTAGVYLVVRGLDNVHQGFTKDPKDPVAILLVDWAKKNATTTGSDDSSDKAN